MFYQVVRTKKVVLFSNICAKYILIYNMSIITFHALCSLPSSAGSWSMQVSCQWKVQSIDVLTESRYLCFDAFSVRQTQTNGWANICGQASKTERFCFIFHFHCQGHILSHPNPERFKSSIIIGSFLLLIHSLYNEMCCALFWVCPQGSLVFVGISI